MPRQWDQPKLILPMYKLCGSLTAINWKIALDILQYIEADCYALRVMSGIDASSWSWPM